MQPCLVALLLLAVTSVAVAQSPVTPTQPNPVWQMEESGTKAGLRGINSVDGTVAWASGTEGTVLRTIDGGAHWTKCAVPDGDKDGATLDFRGVQAWDAMTSIVMASGPGEKSRLYKTMDGCKTWLLVLMNPDKEGFWDGFAFWDRQNGLLVGDPTKVPTIDFAQKGASPEHWVLTVLRPRTDGRPGAKRFRCSAPRWT